MSEHLVAKAAAYTTHKKTEERNIRAFREIRTRDPSKQAISDLRLGKPPRSSYIDLE
jgi:hypothetical protein